MRPDLVLIDGLVRAALLEDAPWGDLTSQLIIPAEARVVASLVARAPGVLCGQDVFAAAMRLTDAAITTRFLVEDGTRFAGGDVLAEVEGPARGVLQGERVALNFTQRLSGIASLTAEYVSETTGTRARIVDTRKTTPGLRVLERYAVRCGGGHNHRFSLSDAVLVKDNHLAILVASGTKDVTEALRAVRQQMPHTAHLEAEVDRLDQIEAVVAAGVGTILLDNFSLDDLRTGVQMVGGRALVEASGGVRLERVRAIAETGVDLISVGALTHHGGWIDLGLDIAQAVRLQIT